MNKLSYDHVDSLAASIVAARRPDLCRFVPAGNEMMTEAAYEFWVDVTARFVRGEHLDAITAIERRFEPRQPKRSDKEAMERAAA